MTASAKAVLCTGAQAGPAPNRVMAFEVVWGPDRLVAKATVAEQLAGDGPAEDKYSARSTKHRVLTEDLCPSLYPTDTEWDSVKHPRKPFFLGVLGSRSWKQIVKVASQRLLRVTTTCEIADRSSDSVIRPTIVHSLGARTMYKVPCLERLKAGVIGFSNYMKGR